MLTFEVCSYEIVFYFKIDKDFNLNLKNGKKLTFHNGNYSFDKSLGNFGGYRIYLN